MKIYEQWKRNRPDTIRGESISVTYTYCSFDKGEIDEFERMMPRGIRVMETEEEQEES